ncbi:MAG: hypothetical protein SGARI_001161 [Bacillariaceae sp.]
MNRSLEDSIERGLAAAATSMEDREQIGDQDAGNSSNTAQEQKMAARTAASFPVATNFSPPNLPTSGIERIGFLESPDGRFPPSRPAFDALAASKQLQSSESLTVSPAMEEKPLHKDFQPSEFTVIIGRGKKIRESQGNIHLRTLASTYLSKYSDSRQAKTEVVNSILGIIRAVCPNGGAFVRCEQGQWYEVGDRVAREKVGYVFRDLLSDQYESSCKSKTAKRKRQQKEEQAQQQKQLQEEQIRTQMAQMQQRIMMQHQQQQPLNVSSMASFSPRMEQGRSVQRSFSDSMFGCTGSIPPAPPLSHGFLPPTMLHRGISAPTRSLPSSPLLQRQQSLQLQHQQQQELQQQMSRDDAMTASLSNATMPIRYGSSYTMDLSSSHNASSSPRIPRRYASSSDYSECYEASSATGLDDSANASPRTNLSRVTEEGQAPAPAAGETDLSSLLTSPLIDCHLESNKKHQGDP